MLNTEVFLGQRWTPAKCTQNAAKHAQIAAKRAQIEKWRRTPTWVGYERDPCGFLSVCSAFCLNEHFCKTSALFVAKEASGQASKSKKYGNIISEFVETKIVFSRLVLSPLGRSVLTATGHQCRRFRFPCPPATLKDSQCHADELAPSSDHGMGGRVVRES